MEQIMSFHTMTKDGRYRCNQDHTIHFRENCTLNNGDTTPCCQTCGKPILSVSQRDKRSVPAERQTYDHIRCDVCRNRVRQYVARPKTTQVPGDTSLYEVVCIPCSVA